MSIRISLAAVAAVAAMSLLPATSDAGFMKRGAAKAAPVAAAPAARPACAFTKMMERTRDRAAAMVRPVVAAPAPRVRAPVARTSAK